MLRRGPPQAAAASSSEDEDDAFSAFSRRTKSKAKAKPAKTKAAAAAAAPPTSLQEELKGGEPVQPPTVSQQPSKQRNQNTSAGGVGIKRHHGALSEERRAKMDDLLSELASSSSREPHPRRSAGSAGSTAAPPVKGSFVQPGEETVTTNLFVGNLETSITEDQLTEAFSQFGELYSVKIMWARTAEERARNRHSGFVCFQHRADAQEALEALDETDPFNVGRRIMIRWGKHVKKELQRDETLQQQQQQQSHVYSNTSHHSSTDNPVESALVRKVQALRRRGREQRTYANRHQHPDSGRRRRRNSNGNKSYNKADDLLDRDEMAQFDRLFRFELCASRGAICRAMAFCFEHSAAWAQISDLLKRLLLEPWNDNRNDQTTMAASNIDGGNGNNNQSNQHGHAHVVEDSSNATVSRSRLEIKLAQLYALSDILFNSQQPGVRNAFRYRDTIEQMAGEIFSLYGTESQKLGRMAQNRVDTAVSSVLAAWTNWSVYNPSFLDELHARFKGRPFDLGGDDDDDDDNAAVADANAPVDVVASGTNVNSANALVEEERTIVRRSPAGPSSPAKSDEDEDGEPLEDGDAAAFEVCEDEEGGVPLDEDDDEDGVPLEEGDDEEADDVDGLPLDVVDHSDDDADGVPLVGED